MSSSSIAISCWMTTVSIILSLLPFYAKRNYFIVLTQVFTKFAYSSILEYNEGIKIIDKSINVTDVMFEQFYW